MLKSTRSTSRAPASRGWRSPSQSCISPPRWSAAVSPGKPRGCYEAADRAARIAAIARHAGVSRKFIYAHPDLRAQIEQRAHHNSAQTTAQAAADGRASIASLRTDLANARAQNPRLRQQLRALEQRLSETLGRDLADQLGSGAAPADELRRELEDARGQLFELTDALADTREDLDAVREINRKLLAAHNRPGR